MDKAKGSRTVRQGVDMEEMERFCAYAKTHPEAVQFVLEAAGSYEGRVAHTQARTGPYTLGGERIDRVERESLHRLGAHREVEQALGFTEPTDREEAMEVALAALTGCINTAISSSAVARGLELSRLETKVSVGWDPFVFLHLLDPVAGDELVDQFRDLAIEIEVAGEDLTEADRVYLQDSVRRSAVYNLVSLAHRSAPVVRMADSE